jgi:hypothetical protein
MVSPIDSMIGDIGTGLVKLNLEKAVEKEEAKN